MASYLHHSKRLLSYFAVSEYLDPLARLNLKQHVRASFYEGIYIGGCANFLSYVAKKFGNASDTQVQWLFSANAVGMFLAVFIPMLLRGARKVHQRTLLLTVRNLVILSIPIVFFSTFHGSTANLNPADSSFSQWFIGLVIMAMILGQAPITSLAGLSMEMYPDSHRMRCVGCTSQVQIISIVVSNFLTGRILDHHPDAFWWLFPLYTVASFVGVYHFRKLRSPVEESGSTRFLAFTIFDIFRGPLRNRRFLMYQLAFSLGGLPNLMALPLYFLFISDKNHLNLDYSLIATLTVTASITTFLTVSWWARILDRFANPFVGRGMLMVVWTFHPLVFAIAATVFAAYAPLQGSTYTLMVGLLLLAYFLAGTLDAGGSLNWLLGSTSFAPQGEAAMYSGAHMVFNATRAFFGPILGMNLYKIFNRELAVHPWHLAIGGRTVVIHEGFLPMFLIAMAMMACASAFQFILRWHYGPMLPPEPHPATGGGGEAGGGPGNAGPQDHKPSQRMAPMPLSPGGSQ